MNSDVEKYLKNNLYRLKRYMHTAAVLEEDRELLSKAVIAGDLVVVRSNGKFATLSWVPASWKF